MRLQGRSHLFHFCYGKGKLAAESLSIVQGFLTSEAHSSTKFKFDVKCQIGKYQFPGPTHIFGIDRFCQLPVVEYELTAVADNMQKGV
jgi:hypothetical protein